MKEKQSTTYKIVLVALMAAVVCVLGPLSITLPFTPVPISLAVLGILFAVYIIGWKLGTLCTVVYLLIGLAGLPVFSKGNAGPGALLGPTGGYLIGFIFMAAVAGIITELTDYKLLFSALGLWVGVVIDYLFGTVWFSFQQHMSFMKAFTLCVVPFVIGDILKIVLVLIVGPILRKRLLQANLLPTPNKKQPNIGCFFVAKMLR